MAFTYDKLNDMENIVKATGLTEDELASLIIAKENEGWTNYEIADLLVSNFDNKEYASKAQNELDALYSLGFNPPKDYNPAGGKRYQQWQEYKEDPSLIDRFKSWFATNKDADEQRNAAAREAIAKSVNDWRDSHPEQWRVGMVNAMFGDNNMLSQYYAAKHAAEEGEKNRQAQRDYNQYLKEYDRAKLAQDEALRKAQEEKEKDIKRSELLGKIKDPAIGAKEKAIYRTQLEALGEGNKELADKIEKAIREDVYAQSEKEAAEATRQRNAMRIKAEFMDKIKKAKTEEEKLKLLNTFNNDFAKARTIMQDMIQTAENPEEEEIKIKSNLLHDDYANLTQEDVNEVNAKTLGVETQEAANRGAVKGAVASGVAEDVKTAKAEKEAKKKLADSARKKKAAGQEGRITKKEQEALDEGF